MEKAYPLLFLIFIILSGCGQAKSAGDHFFTQDLTNYGFIRYENDEAICYIKDGNMMSCVAR